MTNSTKSYGQILRSTSIIGGASVVNIVVGLLRIKVAAVLLGTAGGHIYVERLPRVIAPRRSLPEMLACWCLALWSEKIAATLSICSVFGLGVYGLESINIYSKDLRISFIFR